MSAAVDEQKILMALQEGALDLQGQFVRGSNYTFLGQVAYEDLALKVVYKPRRGEQPLWDFPAGSLAKREVAAYLVSRALGWDLVPPTVYRRKAPFGAGSLQEYIEHDPNYHYFNFSEGDRQRLRPAALLDLVINNADRKGSHVLLDAGGHVWLIDHGVCFHVEDKLRTVIWDFAGEPIPQELLDDLARLAAGLKADGELRPELRAYLRAGEIAALAARCRALLDARRFPLPDRERRMVPWPPV